MSSRHDSTEEALSKLEHTKGMHLTPEELTVLRQCNSEGFYKRGVPGAIGFALASFYALKNGFLKPHARFGMIPSLSIAGIAGCLVGSLSYKSICVERVLAVPNGSLKKQLDAMTRRGQPESTNVLPEENVLPEKYSSIATPVLSPESTGVSGSDYYNSNHNFDVFTGGNTEGDQLSNYDTTMPLPKYNPGATSYDDLRQRNREDYIRNSAGRQNAPPPRAPPQGQGYPPMDGPRGPILEDVRPFDRDRVPQYNLDR